MVRASGVNKASWLLTKDHLIKMPMKKGVLDVELANLLVGGEGDREDDPDGSRFNHRAEGLIEVDAVFLRESAQHPSSFVAIEGAIRLELVTKDPFAGDDVGVG